MKIAFQSLLLLCLTGCFFIKTTTLVGQRNAINTYNALTLHTTYAAQLPGGDLSNRFGYNTSVGGGLDYLTEQKNWIFGIKVQNIFGNQVKEDVIARLRDKDGLILGSSEEPGAGSYANVALRQRGWYGGLHIGKLVSWSKNNQRAGLRWTLGAGILQHKVRIQDNSGNADQLQSGLLEGYDLLSNGLAFRQFIGYQQLNREKGINFLAGLELIEGFTDFRRRNLFVENPSKLNNRFDLLIGFRVGWTFTFYVGERAEDIEY